MCCSVLYEATSDAAPLLRSCARPPRLLIGYRRIARGAWGWLCTRGAPWPSCGRPRMCGRSGLAVHAGCIIAKLLTAADVRPFADGLDEEVHTDRPSIPPFPSRPMGHLRVAAAGQLLSLARVPAIAAGPRGGASAPHYCIATERGEDPDMGCSKLRRSSRIR